MSDTPSKLVRSVTPALGSQVLADIHFLPDTYQCVPRASFSAVLAEHMAMLGTLGNNTGDKWPP